MSLGIISNSLRRKGILWINATNILSENSRNRQQTRRFKIASIASQTQSSATSIKQAIDGNLDCSKQRQITGLETHSKKGLFGYNIQTPEDFNHLSEQALKRANQLVETIAEPNPSTNVVALFDELSNTLCKVADLAEFIRNVHPLPRFRSASEKASFAISNHVEKLNTDRRLYDSLKSAKFDDEIDEIVAKLFIFDFELSGIHLDEQSREQVLALNESILKYGSIFASNISENKLVKIPPLYRHIFGTTYDKTLLPGMFTECDKESYREAAYKMYLQYDETQDHLLRNLLTCRLKMSKLCGFESYAHRAIKGSIVGNPDVVSDLLNAINDKVKPLAYQDYKKMKDLKQADVKDNRAELNAWDVPYYSANYKRNAYSAKLMQCLPYFSIGSCMDGLNMIFNRLYGVKMQVEECASGETWHDDVIKLNIIDEESNYLLGHIYCDLFDRPMKQHQDCHHTIRGGCRLADGTYQLPIVVLVLGIPNTNDNSPALLSTAMVDNLFHEMGHAMHSMLARTKYQHITGTRCSTDLAEVPAILMELFASDPRIVSKFARHYSTGETLPSDMMKCWLESKKVFLASEIQLQTCYAALDQTYHSPNCLEGNQSTTDVLRKVHGKYYSLPYVEGTSWQLRFSHLVGYGAKYYSYLLSRSLAIAIWNKYFQQDPLSRKAGEIFKLGLLRHGGGKPADFIITDLLGENIDMQSMAQNLVSYIQPPKIDNS